MHFTAWILMGFLFCIYISSSKIYSLNYQSKELIKVKLVDHEGLELSAKTDAHLAVPVLWTTLFDTNPWPEWWLTKLVIINYFNFKKRKKKKHPPTYPQQNLENLLKHIFKQYLMYIFNLGKLFTLSIKEYLFSSLRFKKAISDVRF